MPGGAVVVLVFRRKIWSAGQETPPEEVMLKSEPEGYRDSGVVKAQVRDGEESAVQEKDQVLWKAYNRVEHWSHLKRPGACDWGQSKEEKWEIGKEGRSQTGEGLGG